MNKQIIEEPLCKICKKKATIYAVDPYKEETLSKEDQEKLKSEWWCNKHYLELLLKNYSRKSR